MRFFWPDGLSWSQSKVMARDLRRKPPPKQHQRNPCVTWRTAARKQNIHEMDVTGTMKFWLIYMNPCDEQLIYNPSNYTKSDVVSMPPLIPKQPTAVVCFFFPQLSGLKKAQSIHLRCSPILRRFFGTTEIQQSHEGISRNRGLKGQGGEVM